MNTDGKNIPFTNIIHYDDMLAAIENPMDKKVVINGFDTDSKPDDKKELTDAQANFRVAVIVIAFLGGIIAAIVFSQIEPLLSFACVGAIFFLIGMVTVIQGGISFDSLPALIIPAVGALMIAIPCIILYHRTHPESPGLTRDTVLNIILGCMAVIGLFMIIIPVISHRSKMRRCSQTIYAKCIFRDQRSAKGSYKRFNREHTRNFHIYAPVWQYDIGEVLFVTKEAIFTNHDVPQIGESREIRYDPNEPSYIYRPVLRNNAVEMIMGAMLVLAGLGTLYLRLK